MAVRDPVVVGMLEKNLDAELAAGQGPKKVVLSPLSSGRATPSSCPPM
jgi:hypothetical protein